MNLSQPGAVISDSEVTNISENCFWLLVDDREYFVPFSDYPGFGLATVPQIFKFKRLSPSQFSWPELDIDIELESLEHPERFTLVFQP